MHHLPAGLGINGVLDREEVLDGGKRLFIRRVFAEDLLDIEDLDERQPFRPRDPVTGERPLPNVAWFEDALREGRLRIVGGDTPKASTLVDRIMVHASQVDALLAPAFDRRDHAHHFSATMSRRDAQDVSRRTIAHRRRRGARQVGAGPSPATPAARRSPIPAPWAYWVVEAGSRTSTRRRWSIATSAPCLSAIQPED